MFPDLISDEHEYHQPNPSQHSGEVMELFTMHIERSIRCSRRFALGLLLTLGIFQFTRSIPAEALNTGNEIRVVLNGKHVTSYLFSPKQKYPYFYPVNGPMTGRSLTTESSDPYPHHHSLFFGCDRVNGGNYWQDEHSKGRILSRGPEIVQSTKEQVIIRDVCDWKRPNEPAVLTDERWISVGSTKEGHYVFDFQFILRPQTRITIEKTNHSLFSARMKPELSVHSGGILMNAESESNEAGTWGKRSAWCDFSGTHNGQVEGLAIFQSPRNPWYPNPWFTRDYGFMSPTPMYWLKEGVLTLSKEDVLVFRYRVVVHAGNSQEARINERFSDYLKAEGALD